MRVFVLVSDVSPGLEYLHNRPVPYMKKQKPRDMSDSILHPKNQLEKENMTVFVSENAKENRSSALEKI